MHTKKVFFLFLFCLFSFSLFSQEYYIQDELLQTFEWPKDDYVLWYDIEIEQLKQVNDVSSEFISYITSRVKQNHFSISLAVGNYRYRVIAYDLLGRQASISEWDEIEIKRLIIPKILQVEDNLELPDGRGNITIELNGLGITNDSKIELVRNDDIVISQGKILSFEDDENIIVSFIVEDLKTGDYFIRITNPGTLVTESELIEISDYPELPKLTIVGSRDVVVKNESLKEQTTNDQKPKEKDALDVDESIEQTEQRLLYDNRYAKQLISQIVRQIDSILVNESSEEQNELKEENSKEVISNSEKDYAEKKNETSFYLFVGPQIQIPLFGNQYSSFSENFLLYGGNLKYSWLSSLSGIKLGCEIEVMYDLTTKKEEAYSAYLDCFLVNLSLIMAKNLNEKFAINSQIGITSLTNGVQYSQSSGSTDNIVSGSFGFLASVSVDYKISEKILLRTGCNYEHIMMYSNHLGLLIPFINIGCIL